MIWSGLPYSQEDIERAYNEGAEIDMSKINFPSCKTLEENYKAAFIYLRNSDYNVKFNFTNMDYNQKVVLLKEYMNTGIKYDIPILDSTLLQILFACAGYNKQLDSILNELELITFVADQFEFCFNIWQLVASLPMFAISRLQLGDDPVVDFSNVEKTNFTMNTITLTNMMRIPEFDDLYALADQVPHKFYTNIFTMDNNELFEAMTKLSFMVALYGMMDTTPEEYKEFLSSI